MRIADEVLAVAGDELVAPGVALTVADVRALLARLPDACVDAVVTDPPYEIDFTRQTGQGWDRSGVAFDVAVWREMLRVVKPGANLVAFGAPRTFHRLMVAVEDAGWEIRDSMLAWVKSYGFPKAQQTQAVLRRRGFAQLAEQFAGVQNVLKPAYEPIVVARKPLDGDTLADNIIRHGVGGLGVDVCRVPTVEDRSRTPGRAVRGDIVHMVRGQARSRSHPGGRWPTNTVLVHAEECAADGCVVGCPVGLLEVQQAGAARYFPQFFYAGRAAKSERPRVEGVAHPTVKPVSLLRWLVALAAPLPGMVVLDPFAGSGTTGQAAVELGRCAVLGEVAVEYAALIRARLAGVG